jgi:hypothetical protein
MNRHLMSTQETKEADTPETNNLKCLGDAAHHRTVVCVRGRWDSSLSIDLGRVDRTGPIDSNGVSSPERRGEQVPRTRHRSPSPPKDDRQLWRTVGAAIVQGLSREALVVILREIWRGGPW